MNIKDYLILNVDLEERKARKEIRLIKKDLSNLSAMRVNIQKTSEEQLMEILVKDEDLKKNYEELSEKLKEKERSDIQKMIKSGKIREIINE